MSDYMKPLSKSLVLVLFGTFALAAPASQAGWNIKLGNKVIAGKPDEKKPEEKKAAAPAEATPSIICDSAATLHLCYAFSGTGNADSKASKGNEMACKFMKGRYLASSSCSTEGVLGVCTVLQGQPKEYKLYYHPGGKLNFNKESAEKDCKNAKSSLHAQGAGQWSGL